jgi:CDGSH-type Zn-finger protein
LVVRVRPVKVAAVLRRLAQRHGFTPRQQDIAEAKTVAWCGCKHSNNGCFCDGSHAKLP